VSVKHAVTTFPTQNFKYKRFISLRLLMSIQTGSEITASYLITNINELTLTFTVWSKPSIWLSNSNKIRWTSLSAESAHQKIVRQTLVTFWSQSCVGP